MQGYHQGGTPGDKVNRKGNGCSIWGQSENDSGGTVLVHLTVIHDVVAVYRYESGGFSTAYLLAVTPSVARLSGCARDTCLPST